jgi:L-iditol 2-dehydrogenase
MVEPLSIAFHAINRTTINLNDTAVVVGAGMIGLLVIQLLKLSSCGRIIAVDLVREKLDMAAKFGADVCLKSDEVDVAKEVFKITGGRGADLSFEVVGLSPTLQTAIHVLRKGGSLTLVGNLKPSVDFPLQLVVTRQISLNGSCASAGEYPDCLDLIARKKVDVDAFISAVAPMSEGGAWFDRLYRAEPGLMKVILKP